MEVVPKELGFHEEDFPLASSSNLKPDHALLEFSLINNHPSSSQVFVIKSTCVKHLIAVSPACGFIKSSDQIKVLVRIARNQNGPASSLKNREKFLIQSAVTTIPHEFWNAKSAKEELLRTQAIHRLDLIIPMKVIRNGSTREKSFTNPSSEEASTLYEHVTFASVADKGNEFFYDATDDNVDKSIPNAALVMEHDDSPIFISNKAEQVISGTKPFVSDQPEPTTSKEKPLIEVPLVPSQNSSKLSATTASADMANIEAIDRSEIILLKELNHRVTALEAKARRVTKGINVGKLGLGAVGFRRFSFVREATTTPDVDKKDAFADNNMNLPLLLFTATVLGVTVGVTMAMLLFAKMVKL